MLLVLIEMNTLERSEIKIKKCTDYDTYSGCRDPLPFLLGIVQTHQLAPTGDSPVDEDDAVQAYYTMKQNLGEFMNKYQVRMGDTIKVMERLGIDLPSPQQQAMRYLKSLDCAKHRHMLSDCKS